MPIATINPATGEVVATFEALTPEELDERIGRAHRAATSFRRTSFAERAEWMRALADVLDAEAPELARTLTTEMGKTLKSAEAEVRKCAVGCRYYADNAEAFLADEPADAGAVKASKAWTAYQPLGVVLAVMPWNFPLWQVFRFLAPALMAGNVGLLKHASNVPQTAVRIEELVAKAGFPDGAFQTLLIGSDMVESVLRDPRVAAATLTGSTPAGQSIASICGEELKPTVLELGGSDPFVVLPSADLDAAAKVAVTARCQNNGQSCIAAKRFIVHRDVADAWIEKFVAAMGALRLGDPTEDGVDVGPLATESGRKDVVALVEDAKAKGATVLLGGETPDGPGWYYPPTVITDVTRDMDLFAEEAFGPVAQVHVVSSIEEAIELGNDSEFGLGSNVWTTDEAEQRAYIEGSEAGSVFVNGMVTSYPELPFGGVKKSGYGRELSVQGIRAFCNVKTVWVG